MFERNTTTSRNSRTGANQNSALTTRSTRSQNTTSGTTGSGFGGTGQGGNRNTTGGGF
jgi:hypothetical protein